MGRGISEQQKRILGIAARICDVHGLGVGRGDAYPPDRWRIVGKVMTGCGLADINSPICVHHVWGIPFTQTLQRPGLVYKRNGYGVVHRCGYDQSNPGCFDNTQPGVKAAKVGAAKAFTRLCARDLMRYRLSGYGYLCGYVLTAAGYEIGKAHLPDIDEETIRGYCNPEGWRHRLSLK